MPWGSLEHIFAGRWIAGPDIEDALREAKRLNKLGVGAIVNYLGEDYHRKEVVEDAVQTYLTLIKEIRKRKLKADISTKITELGDLISKQYLLENYSKIVDSAAKNKVFVWLDMEEHSRVDDTIKLYRSKMMKGNTGICIQSYLRRSMKDIKSLPPIATIRLVKGAYSESEKIAFRTRKETTENYVKLMGYLFKHEKRFTIGTHDTEIITEARHLNRIYKRDVTYAMLKGVRNRYLIGLAKKEKVAIYVPFGKEWVRYSYRRLRESSNLKLIIVSFLSD